MKKMIVAAIAFAALSASAELVTVEVCNHGESGTECKVISYHQRPSTGVPADVQQCTGEHIPCVPTEYGVPGWLQDLNDAATDAGLEAPAFPGYEAP